MLNQIGTVKNVPEFIKRAKDKNDPFRLMGFGHRVYKTKDPRAKNLQDLATELFEKLARTGVEAAWRVDLDDRDQVAGGAPARCRRPLR